MYTARVVDESLITYYAHGEAPRRIAMSKKAKKEKFVSTVEVTYEDESGHKWKGMPQECPVCGEAAVRSVGRTAQ